MHNVEDSVEMNGQTHLHDSENERGRNSCRWIEKKPSTRQEQDCAVSKNQTTGGILEFLRKLKQNKNKGSEG